MNGFRHQLGILVAAGALVLSGCQGVSVGIESRKYAQHPLILELARRAPLEVQEVVVSDLPMRLGYPVPENSPGLSLRFVDLPADVAAAGDPYRAQTMSGPRIEFVAELLAGGRTHFRETLVHELIHAATLERLGYFRYFWGTPKWVREGMAAYGAGQAEEYLWLAVLGRAAEEGIDPGVPVEATSFLRDLYTESSLRFEYLDRLRPGGYRAFGRALWERKRWKAALESASGMSVERFEDLAREHALRRVEETVRAIPDASLEAIGLAAKGRHAQALPLLLAELPGALEERRPEAGLLLAMTAASLKYSGRPREAIAAYERLFREFRPAAYANRDDVARATYAGALVDVGRLAEAASAYRDFTRDYPYSVQLLQSVWLHLGKTLNALGRFREAVEALENTRPNGAWTDAIHYMERAKARRGTGDLKRARREARRAVEAAGDAAALRKQAEELLAGIEAEIAAD